VPEQLHTAPRLSFHTGDVDAAIEQVTKTFARHEVQLANVRDLDFQLDLAPASRLTVARMSYGTEAVIHGPPMQLCYHVNLPVTGESVVAQNGVRSTIAGGQAGSVFGPRYPVMVAWSAGSWQYHIKIPTELLEAHAAKLTGVPVQDGIRFDVDFDLRGGLGSALLATTAFLYSELNRPGGLATVPSACQELESALMTQLLMAVPNQLSPLLHSKPAHTRRSKIRELVDFIDEHPDAEISTADLAARAAISPRALQAGFQDVVGMSPTAYLRGVRLDRAHLELASGTAPSITEVAAKWGFYHLGRFSQQYRERFAVTPSQTLNRARR
jgi:AraC-like DNA-binding protein